MPSRTKRPLSASRKCLYTILATLVVLGVVELLVRTQWEKEDLLFSWEKEASPVLADHDNRPLARPNQHMVFQDGPYSWEAHQNAQGFRETQETTASSADGKERWLALGDSWIWGHSTTQGKTFIDRLEHHSGLDIVNAGVIGSSGWDMLQRWGEVQADYRFSGVLLATPHNLPRQREIAPWRNAPYSVDNPPLDWRTRLLLRKWMLPWRMSRQETSVPISQATIDDLLRISQEALSQGMKVVLMMSPRQQDTTESGAWYRAFESLDVPIVGHALSQRACYGFIDTWHPSEAGADAMAQAIAPVLQGDPPPTTLAETPTCTEAIGAGPGKPGWEHAVEAGSTDSPRKPATAPSP